MSEQKLLPYQVVQIVKQNFGGDCNAAAESLNLDPELVKQYYRDAGECVSCGLK